MIRSWSAEKTRITAKSTKAMAEARFQEQKKQLEHMKLEVQYKLVLKLLLMVVEQLEKL